MHQLVQELVLTYNEPGLEDLVLAFNLLHRVNGENVSSVAPKIHDPC